MTSLPMVSNYDRQAKVFNKTWNITGNTNPDSTPGITLNGSGIPSSVPRNSALFLSPIPVIPTTGSPANDIEATYPYTLGVNLTNLTIQGNTAKGDNGSTSINTASTNGDGGGGIGGNGDTIGEGGGGIAGNGGYGFYFFDPTYPSSSSGGGGGIGGNGGYSLILSGGGGGGFGGQGIGQILDNTVFAGFKGGSSENNSSGGDNGGGGGDTAGISGTLTGEGYHSSYAAGGGGGIKGSSNNASGSGGIGGGGGGGALFANTAVNLSLTNINLSGNNARGGNSVSGGGGGAIFMREGSNLTVNGSLVINGNTVVGGTGAGNGSAFGSGIFLQGNGSLTFVPTAGQNQTVNNVIADQTGNGGINTNNAGSWSLIKQDAGMLTLTCNNTYSGGTVVKIGILSITSDQNLGTPYHATMAPNATLTLGDTTTHGILLVNNGSTISRPITLNGLGGSFSNNNNLT